MTKQNIVYFALGATIVGPILFVLLMSFRNIGDKPSQDYLVVEKAVKEIRCPDGAKMEYASWGKSGLMGICKLSHGYFVAAEGGVIVLEGENYMGKPRGKWTWFDKSGQVQRIETY